MCRGIYKILISTKLSQFNFFDALKLAQKYDKVYPNSAGLFIFTDNTQNTCQFALGDGIVTEPLFIKANDETTCAFYGNLLITFSYDPEPEDSIVRIYVKRPEDVWCFEPNKEGQGCNIMNPTNVHAEVYIAYSVSVLKLNRCIGEDYKSGTWNKRFYREFIEFSEKINGYTELNRIKAAYQK